MAKVLVTGAGGFLGGYLARALLARGDTIVAVQRSAAPELAAAGVKVVRHDLAEGSADALARAAEGCSAVFHVAAKAGIWGPYDDYFRANVVATRQVLAACRRAGVPSLVYTSTPSVVFNGEDLAGADESLPYGRDWLSPYAPTKALAEQEVLAAHQPGTLAVCALRPHLVWGVGDPHLVPRIVARAKAGRLRIIGDGTNRVDLTHVRNAAHGHLLAWAALQEGRAGGRAYFLSDGAPVALWEWINELLRRLGQPPVTRRLAPGTAKAIATVLEGGWKLFRLGGEPPLTRFVATELAKSHWFSIAAAQRDLGYAPIVTNAAGLDELVAAGPTGRGS